MKGRPDHHGASAHYLFSRGLFRTYERSLAHPVSVLSDCVVRWPRLAQDVVPIVCPTSGDCFGSYVSVVL